MDHFSNAIFSQSKQVAPRDSGGVAGILVVLVLEIPVNFSFTEVRFFVILTVIFKQRTSIF